MSNIKKILRISALVLLFFDGISALYGGIAFISDQPGIY